MVAKDGPQDSLGISVGERPAPGVLVQRETARIGSRLVALFESSDGRPDYGFRQTQGLLETDETPLMMAGHDLGIIPPTSANLMAALMEYRRSQRFAQEEMHQLNQHPFVRTASEQQLSTRLHVTRRTLIDLLRENDIVPIVRPPRRRQDPKPTTMEFYRGYFDLDQQALIEEKATGLASAEGHALPTDGFVAVEDALATLGLSQESFRGLRARMEFNPKELVNPKSGKPARYIRKETVEEIRSFMARAQAAYDRSTDPGE